MRLWSHDQRRDRNAIIIIIIITSKIQITCRALSCYIHQVFPIHRSKEITKVFRSSSVTDKHIDAGAREWQFSDNSMPLSLAGNNNIAHVWWEDIFACNFSSFSICFGSLFVILLLYGHHQFGFNASITQFKKRRRRIYSKSAYRRILIDLASSCSVRLYSTNNKPVYVQLSRKYYKLIRCYLMRSGRFVCHSFCHSVCVHDYCKSSLYENLLLLYGLLIGKLWWSGPGYGFRITFPLPSPLRIWGF